MYRVLHSEKLREKIERLHRRIQERFPESGLSKVCQELQLVAGETDEECEWISKPQIVLRVLVTIIVVMILVGLIEAVITYQLPEKPFNLPELVQVFEAGLNALVLIGAAVIFLITAEVRIKRSRTIKALNDLRAIAHVIDMHQLSKDPTHIVIKLDTTPSSPIEQLSPPQLMRYLDYCSEMLSLVGKVAALYAQNFSDNVVLSAVNEVENLTTGLSRKIWQKIMIINLYDQKELM
jgi:hypothetical protein